jgi:voltage-gated potassium channel
MTTENYSFFLYTEIFTVIVFIIDYILRWVIADMKMGKGKESFILYPFTFMAIVDLLSILPGLNLLAPGFKIFRLSRLFRIIRLFKIFRYSSKINVFIDVKTKKVKLALFIPSLGFSRAMISSL